MEGPVWFGDAKVVVRVRADQSDGRVGVWESEEPHGLALPLHIHTREDEQVMLLEGEITFRVGDQIHHLVAGDTLALPRGVPHSHVVTSPKARALTIATPGGFERLFTTPLPADLDAMGKAVEQLGVQRVGPPLAVRVIDGAAFTDFEGFQREFTALLQDYVWTGNLDAFNDILRGGFGTPESVWVLRWENSELSRRALGYEATAERLESLLETCHPSNVDRFRQRIEIARRGEGPTLFDEIVEIIRVHGPGGAEEDDGVLLVLR